MSPRVKVSIVFTIMATVFLGFGPLVGAFLVGLGACPDVKTRCERL